MSYDYSLASKNAEALLKKFGKKLSIRRTVATQDPSTPWGPPTETTSDYTVYGVKEANTHTPVAETLIVERDAVFRVSAVGLSISPRSGDMVVDGSIGYEILEVSALQPADVAVMYELHVKETGQV